MFIRKCLLFVITQLKFTILLPFDVLNQSSHVSFCIGHVIEKIFQEIDDIKVEIDSVQKLHA